MFSATIYFGFLFNTLEKEYIYTMDISRNVYFILNVLRICSSGYFNSINRRNIRYTLRILKYFTLLSLRYRVILSYYEHNIYIKKYRYMYTCSYICYFILIVFTYVCVYIYIHIKLRYTQRRLF